MKMPLHELSFNGALLARGFWLSVWEITTKDGGKVHYVGRTGDSLSLNAQSPFARLSQHLGWNEKSNALRRNLEKRKFLPEECQAFRLVACGPIFPESRSKLKHSQSRDIVAALEKALADALHEAGYDVLNSVKCLKPMDPELCAGVIKAFRQPFPKLQHQALGMKP